MNPADRQQLLDAARDALRAALPSLRAIYAYGSVARGDDWPDSDLDLAVLLAADRSITDPLALLATVSTAVACDVDIVDLRRAGDVLRRVVLEEGVLLFADAPDELLAWEASAMSRYADYRYAVRDILENMHRTKIGYAA